MKAVVLSTERRHELVEVAVPEPEPDEVLVRSHYCGICGSDLHAPEIELFRSEVISGHEFAGEIVATGSAVRDWSVGQRVTANPNGNVCHRCRYCREGRYNLCAVGTAENPLGVARHGGMAEYVALHTSYLHALPDTVDTRRGAWAEPVAVAVRAVRTSPLRIGDTTAVIGGGPVGQLVVQVLRRAGASRIMLIEPSPFRRNMASRLGADETLAPEEASERLGAGELLEVDLVMECSGHGSAVQMGLDLVAAGGSIRLVGMSPKPPSFDAVQAITKEVRILGGFIYVEEFGQAIDLLAREAIDVDTLTTAITPLESFAEAFAALREPESTMKVLVETGRV
ncbi:alcohol dehydrogenase catalytic domain-containing protein [Haloechinothrix sp. LS1_15]|uniref:zinc-dependent alcohol dehydrogenase n=1 Tax=Haloechinothrix sp. LS1_15 TaxID=2652248 RepID=UPI0029489BBA|nr:alcohol dehydrogenase catalytic domain-containing protein [Haloechinothrix sp. LS1_15]MDV6012582.1 alcohol dehydrogenase catalytic domain-containing protein [Haloechinothrix sp. LS1_15]